MLDRPTFWRPLVVILVALIVLEGSTLARGRRSRSRGRSNQAAARLAVQTALRAAQAQAAVAQQALAVAAQRVTALSGEEASAKQRVDTAVESLKTTEDDLSNAEQNIHAIEQQLEEAQTRDSTLVSSQQTFEQAKKEYERLRDRLINSPDFQARYQAALKAPDRLEQIPKLQKEILEHADLERPRLAYDTARELYQQERSRLFAADEGWKSAVEAVRAAQSAHSKAKIELTNGRLKLGSVRDQLRQAAQVAAAAQATLLQAQGAIAKLSQQAKRYGGSGSSKTKSSNGKR